MHVVSHLESETHNVIQQYKLNGDFNCALLTCCTLCILFIVYLFSSFRQMKFLLLNHIPFYFQQNFNSDNNQHNCWFSDFSTP